MKMLYSTCFSLLSLILAAVRTSAAAVGPVLSRSPTPRDQPQYFLKTQLNGGPVFANPVQVPSGIWVVGWSTTKHSATSVTLDGVGHLQFQSQPPMFLTFDNSTASTGVLFATLVPGGDIITGVYLEDNHLAWKGGNQTQEGWMNCYMADRQYHLFFYDTIWLPPPSNCVHSVITAVPVNEQDD